VCHQSSFDAAMPKVKAQQLLAVDSRIDVRDSLGLNKLPGRDQTSERG
jgi:hypothetical protein